MTINLRENPINGILAVSYFRKPKNEELVVLRKTCSDGHMGHRCKKAIFRLNFEPKTPLEGRELCI